MTEAKFRDIVRRQVPDHVKRRLADIVIPSNGGLGPTRQALEAALRALAHRHGTAWPPKPWRERWTAQLARQRKR
jgi:dephospho-CoA kinase